MRCFLGLLLWSAPATAQQQYMISTVAGGAPSIPVATASFGVAADQIGNIYFSSSTLNTVFRIDPSGAITRVAGNSRTGFSGDGGPAIEAQLNHPNGLAVDVSGNLFIADTGNRRIRRVSPGGIIVTVAGSGDCCLSGDGGPAVNTQLRTPFGVSVDASGNLFIADEYDQRVRRVSTDGIISTVAGTGTAGFSGDGGPGASAQLSYPTGVAVDSAGNLFIADYNNHRIRMLSTDRTMTTAVGNGGIGSSGDGGPADHAQLISALAIAVDGLDNLFIADSGSVRKVSSSGTITTVAGGGSSWGTAADGGAATNAAMQPRAVAADRSSNLFIADSFGWGIRKISAAGIITTLIGIANLCCSSGDGGPATAAQLDDPAGVALDGAGNFYIADALHGRIRRVSRDGSIATVASGCYPPDDYDAPCSVTVDGEGNLYVADGTGVHKISSDGANTVVWPKPSYGIAADSAGNLYIADACQIRRLSPTGPMTTIAGDGTCGNSADSAASPFALDRSGNLYFVDGYNGARIRKISPDGTITTVAGGGSGDLADGSIATSGALTELLGLAADDAGNVYYQEFSTFYPGNSVPRRIRKVSADGVVTTIAGSGNQGYSGDGGPALLALLNPSADERGNNLAVDSAGNVYIADGGNDAIRLLRPVNQPSIGAVVDAASRRPDPISPGKIVVIYGASSGPSELIQNQPGNGRIGTELAGTAVSFNGIAAPILYASATQVAAIVPYAIDDATAQVSVTYQGKASAAFPVAVAPSAPSLFTLNQTGSGQASAINASNGMANSAANPVRIGDYITLYATGEGQTIPAGVDGRVVDSTSIHPALPWTVTVGGIPAFVQYAGGAPGQVAGLMQINVRIPTGVRPGGYVPIVLQVGNASTTPDAVWIAVSQ
jgi:uncharacterized protein (TIGR03437 family)